MTFCHFRVFLVLYLFMDWGGRETSGIGEDGNRGFLIIHTHTYMDTQTGNCGHLDLLQKKDLQKKCLSMEMTETFPRVVNPISVGLLSNQV